MGDKGGGTKAPRGDTEYLLPHEHRRCPNLISVFYKFSL